jgi:uncharacterized protein (TIGR02145 family)
MMIKNTLLLVLSCFVFTNLHSQNIVLTFTAIDNTEHVQLDSIKLMNRTQESDTVLYWPDTIILLNPVGIFEMFDGNSTFKIMQNYPNPVIDRTTISLYIPEKDQVELLVSDMMGRVVHRTEKILDRGMNNFSFIPGGGNLYFFTARWRGESGSIRMVCLPPYSAGEASLEYSGDATSTAPLKTVYAIQEFVINPGDELLLIGYYDTLQSGMLDSPEESEDYTFQFAYNIPCPGTPTVEYGGQTYNTVQIMSQCWLKENLNVGEMISKWTDQSDNGTIEKYCYDNEPDSCAKYGGYYQWWEMMQYTEEEGVQGICPPGWHLPTDEEWKVLEGAVDSQFDIGDDEWNSYYIRGLDAGANLKTTSGWQGDGSGTDLFGFSALPGGVCLGTGLCKDIGKNGFWWSSTEYYGTPWYRFLSYFWTGVDRGASLKYDGFSVRCIKND